MKLPFTKAKKPAGPAPMLLRIGETAAVDPLMITAMYRKDGKLVIRFGGIGIMELTKTDLYKSVQDTFNQLLEYQT